MADALSLEEFEERVDRSYHCRSVAEFDELTIDLAPPAAAIVIEEPARAIVPAQSDPSLETKVEITRAARCRCPWREDHCGARQHRASRSFSHRRRHAVRCRNVEIDLRDVMLAPGVTTLKVHAVLGNVEITVPRRSSSTAPAPACWPFSSINHVPEEQMPTSPSFESKAAVLDRGSSTRPVQGFSKITTG